MELALHVVQEAGGGGQWGFAEAVVDVVSVQLELPQAERRASLAPNKQI